MTDSPMTDTPQPGSSPADSPSDSISADPGPAPQTDADLPMERPGGLLSRVDGHLVMYHDPGGLQAEQYRACRTNLTALNRNGAPWALVITSSKRGEGKSVTAANLAACLAEIPGTRVCLLDLDSRAPSQAQLFGADQGIGVTELVSGEATINQVLKPTVVPGLDFVSAGREHENPAELLGGQSFIDVMDDLKRRYSWVIMDAPPVNPWTDACVVSALVNGALVVVRLQDTPRATVTRTMESINAAGGKVMGSFLTGLIPDVDEAAREGYARADSVEWGAPDEGLPARQKARERAEKRLRRQERAVLKQQNKAARKRDADEDSPV
jgi:capsular exopolysaccharide synthesis family protein